jgi:hypothetical protein
MYPRLTIALTIVSLAACKGDKSKEAPSQNKTVGASAAPARNLPPVPEGDASLQAILAEYAKCKWNVEDERIEDEECDARDRWNDEVDKADDSDDYEKLAQKRAATLIHGLASGDLAMRRAAATLLENETDAYETHPSMSSAIVGAYRKEKDKSLRFMLASLAGYIDVEETGLVRELLDAYRASEPDHKSSLVGALGVASCKECAEILFEEAEKSEEKASRQTALANLKPGMDDARACKLFIAAVKENDFFSASTATRRIGEWKEACAAQVPALVDEIKAQGQANTLSFATLESMRMSVIPNHKLSAAQMKTVLEAARKTAQNSKQGAAKSAALRLLGKFDPGSRKFIEGFKEDDFLKSTVEQVLAEMDGKKK